MERAKDIIIHQKSHSSVIIECNCIIAGELSQFFSAMAANYMFAPLFKAKIWDGRVRFFSLTNNELAIGLIEKLYQFAKLGNYTIQCNFKRHNEISREEFQRFVDTLNIVDNEGDPMEVRNYQFEAAYQCICKKNICVEAATSAGKSLIIYIIMRFMVYRKMKSIIICPGKGLVEQMYSDFKSYGWNAEKYCHRVYEGHKKYFDAPVTIACWQSMISTKVKNQNPYDGFDCLLVDEAHGAKSKSLTELAKVCINAEYRFGFSGTYPDPTTADWFSITGSLGPIQMFANYKFLQDNGYITPLKIYNIILKYKKEFKLQVYNECGKDYSKQCDMIHNNPDRNKFIMRMVQNLNENVLVLFTKKTAHGHVLKELFERELKDKIVVYIDGDVPVEEREGIRSLMEDHDNVVLLGSYGCVSTGTNIKNLSSIIFASGYKSRIKTLQSIGRGLRLHKNKKYTKLFDFADDCCFQDRNNDIKFINHSMNHYKERSVYYQEENWNVMSKKFDI
jgi:superfamily II DNA or RNA helicase